jgi:hypothetical protein
MTLLKISRLFSKFNILSSLEGIDSYLYSKVKSMIRLIFLLAFISYSCSPSAVVSERPSVSPHNTYSQDSLYIHFTGGFKNDSLIIEYADILIIEPDITTGALGLAKAIVIPSKGTDRIHVSLIRPNSKYSTEIVNKGDNFIEVWYCIDDELKNYSRTEPFEY